MSHALTPAERINMVLRPVPTSLVYIVGALPGLYIVAGVLLALTGTYDVFGTSLGPDPARTIEHWLGELALQFFIATMTISVLRDYFRLKLIKFRRPLGLLTFFYVVLHLGVWLGLDIQLRWGEVWSDILKRPYITIGMLGFLMMIPLALTSSNFMIRRLGPISWQRLHKLAYLAILLGGIHYVMVQKVWEAESLIYLAAILVLLALRGRRLLR
ncbi:sulfite oxidase heme-binding subunit YedZ [Litoreibacter janthinus]|uniref:Protein-methionine-sulfoxide reductase heme-binding subunit MsrQ n=1 Tax=Litoreibacter janthinus TaxID=670154 RepID=A0A1I6G4T7_9RHOB|nr:protein-methionine-sulfoxide reductase heme-binding subunit MsrQ [Litoreibacter janthinus]SFR37151.1 sulfoxide reductase heme-binding subunit YedZ [Litoreibacter janthinus]